MPATTPLRLRSARWRPDLRGDAPLYADLVRCIADDIRGGRLQPGDRLPSQRELARRLGINFTTVTRAYGEAARRGLVVGRAGRGTHVSGGTDLEIHAEPSRATFLDLTENAPPPTPFVAKALAGTLRDLSGQQSMRALLAYAPAAGRPDDRAAGAAWLSERGVSAQPSNVVVTMGAQHALLAILGALMKAGDTLIVETLTYPGVLAAARLLGIRAVPVAMDEEGMLPSALARASVRQRARVAYLMPTAQNPTVATAGLRRRRELAAVARRRDLTIIEDDVFANLHPNAPPTLAALAPERVFHVAGFSKLMAPGLRVAFVAAPSQAAADEVSDVISASSLMTPSLSVEVVARWIRDGTAARIVHERRVEAEHRARLAAAVFAKHPIRVDGGSFHGWLPLTNGWRTSDFVHHARRAGVGVSPAYAFANDDASAVRGVRICLGAAPSREILARGLRALAALLERRPASAIVP